MIAGGGSSGSGSSRRGPLAWMARNSVAANILMVVLLAGGALKIREIKQEVFPEFELDLIMIPKVGTAADVYALDMMCTQIEDNMKLGKRIGFELIIETALGMANLFDVAASSKRLESLHFGVADYAASTKARIPRTRSLTWVKSRYMSPWL